VTHFLPSCFTSMIISSEARSIKISQLINLRAAAVESADLAKSACSP
jgi:hypothetical protein